MMHHAERRVTVALVVGNHADGEQIVDLLEAALLANNLAMQRVQAFDARSDFRRNARSRRASCESFPALLREMPDGSALCR